jgi:uncharacterized protein (TIGR03437 family)
VLPGRIGRLPVVVQNNDDLLVLRFNNTLIGENGASPTQATGTSFQPGVSNQGVLLPSPNQLFYASAGHINATEGTFECWLKPTWNGNDGQAHFILQYGTAGGILIGKDGANNLRIILNRFGAQPGGEVGAAFNISSWVANQWHHVAFTWSSTAKQLAVYVDGTLRQQTSFNISLPAINSTTFQIGGDGAGSYLQAVVDNLRISSRARTAQEIASRMMEGLTVNSWTMNPATSSIELWPTWYWWINPTITADTSAGILSLPVLAANWSSSHAAVAAMETASGRIRALSPGSAAIIGTLGGQQRNITVNVVAPVAPPEEAAIEPFLATPAAGSLYKVPVAIINFLPTRDGVNIDAAASGWTGTVAAMKANLARYNRQMKYQIEERSRFRGYRNAIAPPTLSYQVVKIINVYEDIPPWNRLGPDSFQPDYYNILTRLNAQDWVNNLGVKEVWLWGYHHGRIYPVESNMASPTTGDISNSHRFSDDLPIYNHTYVLYNFNFARGDVNLHNQGHQLEAILSYVNQRQDGNSNLFWNQFCGRNANGSFQQGRSGNTHFPPNGVQDYDYSNPTPVLSDIQDWTPAGTGQRIPVSVTTWRNLTYAWPNNQPPDWLDQANWLLYWMQNMPGLANRIPHGGNRMTNWWAFTGDWDAAIKSGLGLYAAPKTSTSVSAATYSNSALAAESIVSAFGGDLAIKTLGSASLPLPESLAGTQVIVQDSAGVERLASLFFVSPTQVNYQIPAGTALGAATVTILSGDGRHSTETVQIVRLNPGLFSANATGQGLAAAYVQRVKPDGSQVIEPVAQFDAARGEFVAVPIDVSSPTDKVFLVLFGTGIRKVNSLSQVTASVGGASASVEYAGPQGVYVGLDQVNVRLTGSLAGQGLAEVQLTVDGMASNKVSIRIR